MSLICYQPFGNEPKQKRLLVRRDYLGGLTSPPCSAGRIASAPIWLMRQKLLHLFMYALKDSIAERTLVLLVGPQSCPNMPLGPVVLATVSAIHDATRWAERLIQGSHSFGPSIGCTLPASKLPSCIRVTGSRRDGFSNQPKFQPKKH